MQSLQELKDWYNVHIFGHVPFKMLNGCKTILEIGCYKKSLLFKSGIVGKSCVTGVDIFKPYIDSLDETYAKGICGDITKIDFKGHFDAVVCMDVLEHIGKSEALLLVEKMKQWGGKVIITVPNGYVENNILDDNPFQQHVSFWGIEDFPGFKVRGLSGWKPLRTKGSELRFTKPYLFWALISVLTVPLLYRFPKYSWHLLVTKEEV